MVLFLWFKVFSPTTRTDFSKNFRKTPYLRDIQPYPKRRRNADTIFEQTVSSQFCAFDCILSIDVFQYLLKAKENANHFY